MPLTRGHGGPYWLQKLKVVLLLMLGRTAPAEKTLSRMLRRWPGDAYSLASRSHLHAQAGLLDQAIADAQALVAGHPQRGAADWFNLAYLLEKRGRHLHAEPAFRRALQMDAKLDRAWYGLGLTLVRLGRLEEAVTALKRNTELQPMSPYGWVQLARLHLQRHESDEAKRIIRHLKGFEPQVAARLERETGLHT